MTVASGQLIAFIDRDMNQIDYFVRSSALDARRSS